MYLRRLWLLAACMVVGALIMGVQIFHLTLVRGSDLRTRAESLMVDEDWTPTMRGRILDRKGRVLAEDRPSFEVRAHYEFITEARWAKKLAEQRVKQEVGRLWEQWSPDEQEKAREKEIPLAERQIRAYWVELARVLGRTSEEVEQKKSAIMRVVQPLSAERKERSIAKEEQRLKDRGRDNVQVNRSKHDMPVAEEKMSHTIMTGLSDEQAFEIRRLSERALSEIGLRGKIAPIEVVKGSDRIYPMETMRVEIDRSTFPSIMQQDDVSTSVSVDVAGVATHIIGWLKTRQAEDLSDPRFVRPRLDPITRKLDYGYYQNGDLIGATGVERSQERLLRGLRGRVTRHSDTDTVDTVVPVAGNDVSLTIDANVQAKVQALMDPKVGLAKLQPWHVSSNADQAPKIPIGSSLYGAAVVLDIESGDLLALVSTPSFTRDQRGDQGIWSDPVNTPAINKAISGRYPPGSIIKPLVLTAAVTEGVHSLATAINCTGHFYPNSPNVFRCWIYKQSHRTHNEFFTEGLHAPEAIAMSCNIYFYTLGNKLGLERLGNWYTRFGIGQAIDLGLGGEYSGYVRPSGPGNRGHISDAINMAIGQGPVDYTPLHAADIYATLARGGLRIKPRVMMNERPRSSELKLDPAAVDAAIEGLRESVGTPMGTGSHLSFEGGLREDIFRESGVGIAGKTGTAEAPDIVGEDPDGEGPLKNHVLRGGDHSWFVVMVGPEGRPAKYVIAVMMEYAGSGGRVSGPIVNQIIHVLKQEGYL